MSSQKFFDLCSPRFKQRVALVSLWLILAIGLIILRPVILPFVLASLLAYVFHPLVAALGKIRVKSRPMPRYLSVIIIYLVFASAIILLSMFFLPQFYLEIVKLAKELTIFINSIDDAYINSLGQKIEEFFRAYQLPVEIIAPAMEPFKLPNAPSRPNWISIDLIQIAHNLLNDILYYIKSETKNIINSIQLLFSKLISTIFMLMLVIMITGFLLVDVELIKKFAFSLVPVTDRERFDEFLERLDQRLSGVVRGQLIICLVNAVLTLIGLLIFDVKFAFTLATLAGIFSIVPIFGSIISTIPIVLVAITTSSTTAFFSLLWIIGIHILEANFLNPKIMGESAKIHPVLIVLALISGEYFYGIIGALLAVPLMSIVVTIFSSILQRAHANDEGVAKPVGGDTISTKEV